MKTDEVRRQERQREEALSCAPSEALNLRQYRQPCRPRTVLVTNEDGFVEYRLLHPDGHLGSVTDDC